MIISPNIINLFMTYHRYIGHRLYIVFVLTVGAAMTEGIGITLLMPLLGALEGGGLPDDRAGQVLYNLLATMGIENSVVGILSLIGIIFFLKGLLKFGQEGYRGYLQANLLRRLKAQLFDAYSIMDYRYYIKRDTGYFINLINEQTNQFFTSFKIFADFMSQIAMTFTYFMLVLLITWQFALMAMVAGLMLFIVFRIMNSYVRNLSREVVEEMGVINKFLVQTLQTFKYITSTNQTSHLRAKIMQSIQRLTGSQMRQQIALGFTTAIREPLSIFFIIGIVLIQVLILEAPLTPLFVAILLFYRGMNSVLGIQIAWQSVMNMVGSVEIVDEEFRVLQKNIETQGTRKIKTLSEGIELQNVFYSYTTKEENFVLSNISARFPVNKTLAIIGESGAGKSTLVDLLTLILRPNSGIITIDGVPGHEVDLASWRQQIGYVSQETVVFNDTIANNICLWEGKAGSDDDLASRVRIAAEKAYIANFINTLPKGYETMVGDRGIRLSGGQRQRLFIARELFKYPHLLILDEATSSLDTESERYIQESIDDLKGQMTVIIIAHRLSTIRNVDYIYVMDKGRIVEEGHYNTLRKKSNSYFSEMVNMQSL
jgi:ABC-type multidrug transport system fused ATPase/permease subunit